MSVAIARELFGKYFDQQPSASIAFIASSFDSNIVSTVQSLTRRRFFFGGASASIVRGDDDGASLGDCDDEEFGGVDEDDFEVDGVGDDDDDVNGTRLDDDDTVDIDSVDIEDDNAAVDRVSSALLGGMKIPDESIVSQNILVSSQNGHWKLSPIRYVFFRTQLI